MPKKISQRRAKQVLEKALRQEKTEWNIGQVVEQVDKAEHNAGRFSKRKGYRDAVLNHGTSVNELLSEKRLIFYLGGENSLRQAVNRIWNDIERWLGIVKIYSKCANSLGDITSFQERLVKRPVIFEVITN